MHHFDTDKYYNDICLAFRFAGNTCIKSVSFNAFKAYWTEELDNLKMASITWHNIWKNAGRPSSGYIHAINCSCKANYKLAIREAYIQILNFKTKITLILCLITS